MSKKHNLANCPHFSKILKTLIYKSISGIYIASYMKIFGKPFKGPLLIPF